MSSPSATATHRPVTNVALALARSQLGVWTLVFTVMAAAAPLTVVAGGATAGFAITGVTGIPLGYLVVAVILGVFSVGYVAMSRQMVNAGAFYTYVARGLGRPAGVGAAFVAVLAYNTMQVGLYGGFGKVTADFAADQAGIVAPWWMWAFAGWAVIAVLGGRRIDLNGRILAGLLIAEIAVATVFAVVQVAHPAGGHLSPATLSPSNLLTSGLGAALATAIAGYVGFEGTAVFSEESRDPERTVARATYIALAIIGLLYAFCAWAMSVATGPAHIVDRARTDSTEMIFNLVQPYLPSGMLILGHLLFITSLFAALLAFHNTSARYFFALGRESVLPAALGRTSPKTKAPIVGSLTQTGIAAVVLAVYIVAGWDPVVQLFFWLTVLGGLGVLILMTVTSMAVIAYFTPTRRRDTVGVGRGILVPIIATLALAAVLVVTLDQFATLLGVDSSSPLRWELPATYAIAAAIGVAWALICRSTRPQAYAVIGRGANSATSADRPLSHVGR